MVIVTDEVDLPDVHPKGFKSSLNSHVNEDARIHFSHDTLAPHKSNKNAGGGSGNGAGKGESGGRPLSLNLRSVTPDRRAGSSGVTDGHSITSRSRFTETSGGSFVSRFTGKNSVHTGATPVIRGGRRSRSPNSIERQQKLDDEYYRPVPGEEGIGEEVLDDGELPSLSRTGSSGSRPNSRPRGGRNEYTARPSSPAAAAAAAAALVTPESLRRKPKDNGIRTMVPMDATDFETLKVAGFWSQLDDNTVDGEDTDEDEKDEDEMPNDELQWRRSQTPPRQRGSSSSNGDSGTNICSGLHLKGTSDTNDTSKVSSQTEAQSTMENPQTRDWNLVDMATSYASSNQASFQEEETMAQAEEDDETQNQDHATITQNQTFTSQDHTYVTHDQTVMSNEQTVASQDQTYFTYDQTYTTAQSTVQNSEGRTTLNEVTEEDPGVLGCITDVLGSLCGYEGVCINKKKEMAHEIIEKDRRKRDAESDNDADGVSRRRARYADASPYDDEAFDNSELKLHVFNPEDEEYPEYLSEPEDIAIELEFVPCDDQDPDLDVFSDEDDPVLPTPINTAAVPPLAGDAQKNQGKKKKRKKSINRVRNLLNRVKNKKEVIEKEAEEREKQEQLRQQELKQQQALLKQKERKTQQNIRSPPRKTLVTATTRSGKEPLSGTHSKITDAYSTPLSPRDEARMDEPGKNSTDERRETNTGYEDEEIFMNGRRDSVTVETTDDTAGETTEGTTAYEQSTETNTESEDNRGHQTKRTLYDEEELESQSAAWSTTRKNSYLRELAERAKQEYYAKKAAENEHPSSPAIDGDASNNQEDTNSESLPTSSSYNADYNSFNPTEKRKFLRLLNSGMSPSDATQIIADEREEAYRALHEQELIVDEPGEGPTERTAIFPEDEEGSRSLFSEDPPGDILSGGSGESAELSMNGQEETGLLVPPEISRYQMSIPTSPLESPGNNSYHDDAQQRNGAQPPHDATSMGTKVMTPSISEAGVDGSKISETVCEDVANIPLVPAIVRAKPRSAANETDKVTSEQDGKRTNALSSSGIGYYDSIRGPDETDDNEELLLLEKSNPRGGVKKTKRIGSGVPNLAAKVAPRRALEISDRRGSRYNRVAIPAMPLSPGQSSRANFSSRTSTRSYPTKDDSYVGFASPGRLGGRDDRETKSDFNKSSRPLSGALAFMHRNSKWTKLDSDLDLDEKASKPIEKGNEMVASNQRGENHTPAVSVGELRQNSKWSKIDSDLNQDEEGSRSIERDDGQIVRNEIDTNQTPVIGVAHPNPKWAEVDSDLDKNRSQSIGKDDKQPLNNQSSEKQLHAVGVRERRQEAHWTKINADHDRDETLSESVEKSDDDEKSDASDEIVANETPSRTKAGFDPYLNEKESQSTETDDEESVPRSQVITDEMPIIASVQSTPEDLYQVSSSSSSSSSSPRPSSNVEPNKINAINVIPFDDPTDNDYVEAPVSSSTQAVNAIVTPDTSETKSIGAIDSRGPTEDEALSPPIGDAIEEDSLHSDQITSPRSPVNNTYEADVSTPTSTHHDTITSPKSPASQPPQPPSNASRLPLLPLSPDESLENGAENFSVSNASLMEHSIITSRSNWTTASKSSRKRHKGAASKRLSKAKEAENYAGAKAKGWLGSIRDAALYRNQTWDPEKGWVGYIEPDAKYGNNDVHPIGSLHLSQSIASRRAPQAPEEPSDDQHSESQPAVEFPSEWAKERESMVSKNTDHSTRENAKTEPEIKYTNHDFKSIGSLHLSKSIASRRTPTTLEEPSDDQHSESQPIVEFPSEWAKERESMVSTNTDQSIRETARSEPGIKYGSHDFKSIGSLRLPKSIASRRSPQTPEEPSDNQQSESQPMVEFPTEWEKEEEPMVSINTDQSIGEAAGTEREIKYGGHGFKSIGSLHLSKGVASRRTPKALEEPSHDQHRESQPMVEFPAEWEKEHESVVSTNTGQSIRETARTERETKYTSHDLKSIGSLHLSKSIASRRTPKTPEEPSDNQHSESQPIVEFPSEWARERESMIETDESTKILLSAFEHSVKETSPTRDDDSSFTNDTVTVNTAHEIASMLTTSTAPTRRTAPKHRSTDKRKVASTKCKPIGWKESMEAVTASMNDNVRHWDYKNGWTEDLSVILDDDVSELTRSTGIDRSFESKIEYSSADSISPSYKLPSVVEETDENDSSSKGANTDENKSHESNYSRSELGTNDLGHISKNLNLVSDRESSPLALAQNSQEVEAKSPPPKRSLNQWLEKSNKSTPKSPDTNSEHAVTSRNATLDESSSENVLHDFQQGKSLLTESDSSDHLDDVDAPDEVSTNEVRVVKEMCSESDKDLFQSSNISESFYNKFSDTSEGKIFVESFESQDSAENKWLKSATERDELSVVSEKSEGTQSVSSRAKAWMVTTEKITVRSTGPSDRNKVVPQRESGSFLPKPNSSILASDPTATLEFSKTNDFNKLKDSKVDVPQNLDPPSSRDNETTESTHSAVSDCSATKPLHVVDGANADAPAQPRLLPPEPSKIRENDTRAEGPILGIQEEYRDTSDNSTSEHPRSMSIEREVIFRSNAMGIRLKRGDDGFVRVVSVTQATGGSSIVRDGSIEPNDVVKEAAGIDLREPITNSKWGEVVTQIRNAPRPMKFKVSTLSAQEGPKISQNVTPASNTSGNSDNQEGPENEAVEPSQGQHEGQKHTKSVKDLNLPKAYNPIEEQQILDSVAAALTKSDSCYDPAQSIPFTINGSKHSSQSYNGDETTISSIKEPDKPKESLFRRIASCGSPVPQRSTESNRGTNEVPLAHLAFLRTNPTLARVTSAASRRYPAFCGRPDTIFEEPDESSTGKESRHTTSSYGTSIAVKKDTPVVNNVDSSKSVTPLVSQASGKAPSTSSGGSGDNTAFLEALAMRSAISSKPRIRKNQTAVLGSQRQTGHNSFGGYSTRGNEVGWPDNSEKQYTKETIDTSSTYSSGQSHTSLHSLRRKTDTARQAELLAAAKVEAMMDAIPKSDSMDQCEI